MLQSRPEDRRAYIEEAAGVLKHRKRKEKALRKLDGMQVNLTRLTDLTGELRRQLKPLGRQAEIARRAQTVQSELRDARLRLAADDLVTLRGELAREEADEAAARARRAEVEEQLAVARAEQERLELALAHDAPRLSSAQDTWYRLSALAERLRGTVGLARERARHLADAGEQRLPGRDPDELEAEAELVAEQEAELVEAVVDARQQLAEVLEERAEHEATLAAAERAHLAAVRALADRRAGLATLAGRAERCAAGSRRTPRRSSGCPRRWARRTGARARRRSEREAARDATGVEADAGAGLDDRVAEAAQAYEAARERVRELAGQERAAEQQRAHWRARVEALSVGLARRDGSGALLGEGAPDGVLGTLSRSWSTSTPTGAPPSRRRWGSWPERWRSRRPPPPSRRSRRCAARTRAGRCCWSGGARRRGRTVAAGRTRGRRRPGAGRPGSCARPGRWPRPCGGSSPASWWWTTSTPPAGSPSPGSPP